MTVARTVPTGEFSGMRTLLGESAKVGAAPLTCRSVTVTVTVVLSGVRPCTTHQTTVDNLSFPQKCRSGEDRQSDRLAAGRTDGQRDVKKERLKEKKKRKKARQGRW